jgi:hypothetical protein
MNTIPHRLPRIPRPLACLAVGALLVLNGPSSFGSITLYSDSFESYPAQNPAPSPLTNGPAGGQWFFVPPVPLPITTNEQQIIDASLGGSGFNSRVWASLTNNARLTNAISVSALPASPPPYTFRLSFVVGADTYLATRNITFNYAISSSASDLSFVSGRNLDNSQTFTALSGSGLAAAGTTGKSNNRRFEFVFQSSAITTADKIIFDLTRVTNNAGAVLNMDLDDVRLSVDDANGPLVQSVQPVLTLQHVRVNFSEPVDPASAINLANYSFLGGALAVQSATVVAPSVVELWTSDQAPNSTYTLQVSGVLGESGISMTSTQLNFTTPALTISPVRYDAGTTVTQPSGPLDPALPEAGDWTKQLPVGAGFSMAGVTDDNGSGLNAWNVTDSTTATGSPNYVMPIAQTASMNLVASNGWRIVSRNRLVDTFGSTASDQYVLFYIPGVRFGLSWGMDVNGNLWLNPVGGSTYTVSSDPNSYHTNMMVYNPATKAASVYFDGRLITDIYAGQVLAGTGLTFGSASTAGKGSMNYNLVQLDVVGATRPVVLQNPANTTNGVGQKVTFTASFSPFVNAYQWYSNDVAIAGATTASYTTGFITSGYNGSQYRCRAFSALGNTDTAPAVLTVTDDTTPPSIVSVAPSALMDRIFITFSEPVLESYATVAANYTWTTPGLTTLSARLIDPLTVEVTVSPSLTMGSNYTVRVSNVRDTSNLVIVQNSPATMSFPTLSSVARYDAGTVTSSPSGPPDPTTPAGGNWTVTPFTDPNLSTNAVVDDLATGFNAWQVRDASLTTGAFVKYVVNLSTNQQDGARRAGFVLSVRSRIAENLGSSPTLFAYFEDYKLERAGFNFFPDVNNDLVMGVTVTNGFTSFVMTADGSALNAYHLYQAAYDPVTALVSYYYDGKWVASLPFSTAVNSVSELVWGAVSSAGEGAINYNLVDFSVVNGPFVSLTSSGGSLAVEYRGILQTTTQLGQAAAWTAVATNSTGGTNTYVIPAGPSQQFFRARLPR